MEQALRDVEELAAALAAAEEREPAAKRRRLGGGAGPPPPEVVEEVPAWVEALDEEASLALFERALFDRELLEQALSGRANLRDALLTAYITRHPASEDKDPEGYDFTDAFLLDAVDDFDSQEQMWAVLGKDNEAAVRGLITTAAHLDRQYCGQLQNLALLSRAKQMLKGAPEAAAEQLATLLREELAAALARDMDGRSLWHMLVAGEHTEALRRLLPLIAAGTSEKGVAGGDQQAADSPGKQQQREANPLNLADALGSTPLHLAAEASQLEATRLLIEAGASLDMQNRDASTYASGNWSVRSKGLDFAIPVPSLHQTPLHIAAEAGDLDMLRLLLGKGALVDLRDASGSTPLHLALEMQDERAVELLLQAGADPSLANNDMGEGATCLTSVAAMGRPALLRLLLASPKLSAGAVNQAEAESSFTPLMLAARRGSRECCELLLAAGADKAAVNAAGKTALDIAQTNTRAAVVELLQ